MNHLFNSCAGSRVRNFSISFMLMMLLGGCVAVQPFPNAARSGDTVTLAVGSADGMNEANTVVEFYPDPVGDPSNFTTIPVREIIKIYPDKTSQTWLSDTAVIPRRSSHGPWLSIVVADLPALPVGTGGVMRVSTNGQVLYPRFAATPNGTDIPMTILSGTGTPNDFYFRDSDSTDPITGNLGKLGSLFQVIVKPEVPAEGQAEDVSFGAIEMSVTIPIAELGGGVVLDEGIAVVLDDQPQNTLNQTNLIWKRSGDVFDIMLISPKGMYGHEARVSVVPRWPEYLYGVNGTPVLNSITYYNLNGDLHTGPLPAMPEVVSITNPNF